jgi:hypothetical protein
MSDKTLMGTARDFLSVEKKNETGIRGNVDSESLAATVEFFPEADHVANGLFGIVGTLHPDPRGVVDLLKRTEIHVPSRKTLFPENLLHVERLKRKRGENRGENGNVQVFHFVETSFKM